MQAAHVKPERLFEGPDINRDGPMTKPARFGRAWQRSLFHAPSGLIFGLLEGKISGARSAFPQWAKMSRKPLENISKFRT